MENKYYNFCAVKMDVVGESQKIDITTRLTIYYTIAYKHVNIGWELENKYYIRQVLTMSLIILTNIGKSKKIVYLQTYRL